MSNVYHPVAEYVDMVMHSVLKVAVCGPLIRYRRSSLMAKTMNARVTYSNAFDPLARHWKTERAALDAGPVVDGVASAPMVHEDRGE